MEFPHHPQLTSTQLVQSYTFNTSLVVSYHIFHSVGLAGAVEDTSVTFKTTAHVLPFTLVTHVLFIVLELILIPVQAEYVVFCMGNVLSVVPSYTNNHATLSIPSHRVAALAGHVHTVHPIF